MPSTARRLPPPFARLGAIALLAVGTCTPLRAQRWAGPDGARAFAGLWLLDRAASDDPKAAIERALAPLAPAVAAPLRARLLASEVPAAATIDVRLTRDTIVIVRGGAAPVRAPRDGSRLVDRRADGAPVSTLVSVGSGTPPMVREREESPDLDRTRDWGVSADGATLLVSVQVTKPRLGRPLVYVLRYRRS